MKKLYNRMLLISFIYVLSSCRMVQGFSDAFQNKESSVCVRNSADNKYISFFITEVYLMSKGNNGYEKVWEGNIEPSKSEIISVKPGKYSVKCVVANSNSFGYTYELSTGYNNFGDAESGGTLYVNFDGKGLFFE